MNAVTLNTFPSMNAFTSARSWFLAAIVLLHFGFFWALSNGLSIGGFIIEPRISTVRMLPEKRIQVEPPPPTAKREIIEQRVWVPEPDQPIAQFDEDSTAIEQIAIAPEPVVEPTRPQPAPIIVEPQVDPRIGLSEPPYPPSAIRNNETGTVVLAVLVLENGRVGDVRIESSSGYVSLDEAALKQARRWRLKPGARDGVPVAMWKRIPITFRLEERVRL